MSIFWHFFDFTATKVFSYTQCIIIIIIIIIITIIVIITQSRYNFKLTQKSENEDKLYFIFPLYNIHAYYHSWINFMELNHESE
jgi:flagellar basal body-associated protein FliL